MMGSSSVSLARETRTFAIKTGSDGGRKDNLRIDPNRNQFGTATSCRETCDCVFRCEPAHHERKFGVRRCLDWEAIDALYVLGKASTRTV